MTYLLLFIFSAIATGQDAPAASAAGRESGIQLKASVDKTSVHLNRQVTFTLHCEWYGDLDRYEIHHFDNPIVENFEIVGNTNSNRVVNESGVKKAVQEFTFTLAPKSLGMGYIEGVIIKYTDLETDKEFRLTTNRIEVKVMDPLPEPGSIKWVYVVIPLFVLGAMAALFYFLAKRKKKRLAEKHCEVVPVEQTILTQLEEGLDLDGPQLEVSEGIAFLSKLLRKFLREKFEIAGPVSITDDVVKVLHERGLDTRFVNDVGEILARSDVIKFSGESAEKSELERFYTLFEGMLQKSLRGELAGSAENDTKEKHS